MQRNRIGYLFLLLIVMGAGLASRSPIFDHAPKFIAAYAGDTLWALMVFLGVALVFRGLQTKYVAAMAIAFSFSIEISQLYQADWITGIRETRLGALALGAGFLWSDLVCYTAGVLIGLMGEAWLLRPPSNEKLKF